MIMYFSNMLLFIFFHKWHRRLYIHDNSYKDDNDPSQSLRINIQFWLFIFTCCTISIVIIHTIFSYTNYLENKSEYGFSHDKDVGSQAGHLGTSQVSQLSPRFDWILAHYGYSSAYGMNLLLSSGILAAAIAVYVGAVRKKYGNGKWSKKITIDILAATSVVFIAITFGRSSSILLNIVLSLLAGFTSVWFMQFLRGSITRRVEATLETPEIKRLVAQRCKELARYYYLESKHYSEH
jgi:hypothetical protein